MFNWRIGAVAAAAVLSMGAAQAAYVVDTGPGQAGGPALGLDMFGPTSYQHLGTTFTLVQDSSITSVEGWIGGGGNLVFELHQGVTPNGALLFSSAINLPNGPDSWRGASGLDWDVIAGDYTLTVIAQQGFNGQMLISPPNPLGPTWFANPGAPTWATTTTTAGWRIGATANSVPEPTGLALTALALMALGAFVRRSPVI